MELRDDVLHPLQPVVGQRQELVQRGEELDELQSARHEEVEAPEDGGLGEVELLALGHLLQLGLREAVLLLVGLEELLLRCDGV